MRTIKQALKRYDLVCLGGGPAAVPAARMAAAHGKKACIIEMDKLGGTCLNRGCTPKKIYHSAAELHYDWTNAADYGMISPQKKSWFCKEKPVTVNPIKFDWELMHKKNFEFVTMVNNMVLGMCQQMGIDVIKGTGKFVEPHSIKVQSGKEEGVIEGDNIVIATGSTPIKMKIRGIENCVSSDKFFEMKQLPKSIIIVGGGYIGSEIATCLNSFGVKTHVFMREEVILPSFDQELSWMAMRTLQKRGVLFYPNTGIVEVQKSQGGYKVLTEDPKKSMEADLVMMAVGREPNTKGFGFEDVGIKLGPKGEVKTDDYDESSVRGVYAIGDVSGKMYLTPVAKTASKLLIDRLYGPVGNANPDYKINYDYVPSVAFTEPPIARVGLTEQAAKDKFGERNIRVHKHVGPQYQHAMIKNKEPFAVKVISAVKDGKEIVVGINALGRNVDEMIPGFALAMKKGLTVHDLHTMVTVHPTGVEEFSNLF